MTRVPFGRRYPGVHHAHSHVHPHHDAPARHRPRLRAGAIAAIAIVLLLAVWSGATTIYILFRDDALKLLADRQISLLRAHESEMGALLTELDRLKSQKLLDQERVERTLADLTRRQVTLEQRQSALATLAPKNPAPALEPTGSIVPTAPAKPAPLSDLTPRRDRQSELKRPNSIESRLADLAEKLVRVEATQIRALTGLEQGYGGRVLRMRSVLATLGLEAPAPTNLSRIAAAIGGPFLPFFRPDDPFERQIDRIRAAAREAETLVHAFEAVPVRKPVLGDAEITSSFGMRIDPFLKQLALHTGLDFRADPGDPVRAAAAGKVTQAGYNGGYGLMVEIDHGNGLVTRYAHLSAVLIGEGATVAAGAIVGRVGTTGRSTGPHLHYEVRLNGEAVDPGRYLKAGLQLSEGF
jgi:murein DD-endopeptidase MepM/ murein hydrolase activator NlpD